MNYGTACKSVSLFSQPYLDKYKQCYKNIITVNLQPQGPLGQIVRRIQLYPLSPFKQPTYCEKNVGCGLALQSLNTCYNGCELMSVDEIPDLLSYLMSNGYTVDTKITNMLNTSNYQFDMNTGKKLICFITYQG